MFIKKSLMTALTLIFLCTVFNSWADRITEKVQLTPPVMGTSIGKFCANVLTSGAITQTAYYFLHKENDTASLATISILALVGQFMAPSAINYLLPLNEEAEHEKKRGNTILSKTMGMSTIVGSILINGAFAVYKDRPAYGSALAVTGLVSNLIGINTLGA